MYLNVVVKHRLWWDICVNVHMVFIGKCEKSHFLLKKLGKNVEKFSIPRELNIRINRLKACYKLVCRQYPVQTVAERPPEVNLFEVLLYKIKLQNGAPLSLYCCS